MSDIENDQRIVINVRYGGFGLSELAHEKLIEWGVPVRASRASEGHYSKDEVVLDLHLGGSGCSDRYGSWLDDDRTHPFLIRLVEELGDKANGSSAELRIVNVPAGVKWQIEDYGGAECVAEEHRTWP